jgi:hypothetical protein
MKTLSYVNFMGPYGERGWRMLPHPRPCLSVGENFPFSHLRGGKPSPSSSPKGGILRGESEIGPRHLYVHR